jgi:hypothetical protein
MSWIELRGTRQLNHCRLASHKILGLLDTQQITNPFQGFKCQTDQYGREAKPKKHIKDSLVVRYSQSP